MAFEHFWKKSSGVGGEGSVVPMVPYDSPMGHVGAPLGPLGELLGAFWDPLGAAWQHLKVFVSML